MTTPVFRDEFDRKAHDVICLVKYGSVGGSVATSDMRRVGDYLRGGPVRPAVPAVPVLPRAVVPQLPRIPAIPTLPKAVL